MERMRQKEEEQMMIQQQNRALKEQLKANIENQKKGFEDKVRREVDYVK